MIIGGDGELGGTLVRTTAIMFEVTMMIVSTTVTSAAAGWRGHAF